MSLCARALSASVHVDPFLPFSNRPSCVESCAQLICCPSLSFLLIPFLVFSIPPDMPLTTGEGWTTPSVPEQKHCKQRVLSAETTCGSVEFPHCNNVLMLCFKFSNGDFPFSHSTSHNIAQHQFSVSHLPYLSCTLSLTPIILSFSLAWSFHSLLPTSVPFYALQFLKSIHIHAQNSIMNSTKQQMGG